MSEFGLHEPPYEGTQLTFVPTDAAESGQLELVSFVPGPAGMSSVDLGEGVTVSVDYASPGRLCTIEAPVTALNRQAGNVLMGLIGEDRALSVFKRLGSGRDRPVSVGLESPRPRDRSRRAGSSFGDVSFGEAIAGFAVGADRFEHPLVRATAFVSSAADLFDAELFGPVVEAARLESWLRRSAQMFALDATGDRFLDLLDEDEHRRLTEAVSGIVRQYGTGSDWVLLLNQSVRLGGRSYDLADRAAVAATREAEAVAVEAPPEPTADTSAPQSDERIDEPELVITEPGRLTVAFPRRQSKGHWVRVLDRDSLALIALVPVDPEGRRFAEAVIPSNATLDSILIETTDTPLPSSSSSSVDTMIEAVEAGRNATMLSSRGDRSAAERWSLCSGLWRQLGDDTRANLAEAYATGREAVERTRQVHDSLRDVIEN